MSATEGENIGPKQDDPGDPPQIGPKQDDPGDPPQIGPKQDDPVAGG